MVRSHRRTKTGLHTEALIDAMANLAVEYVTRVRHSALREPSLEKVDDATVIDVAFLMIETQALTELRHRGIDSSAVGPIAKMVIAKARAAFAQRWKSLEANPAIGRA